MLPFWRRPLIWAFLFAWCIGLLHTILGWRGSYVGYDFLVHFQAVEALFSRGNLPNHGHITSLGVYAPPGTSWLMVPGYLLFKDVRLIESVGAMTLNTLTLIGIALLARRAYSDLCAALALLLYATSPRGLFFASSLWEVGHTVFIVWIVYFAVLWVVEKKERYLFGALVVWATGMYVFMSIAPALLIVVIAAIIGRIRQSSKAILASFAVSLVIWSPYLYFESKRDFLDLRSQLLVQSAWPAESTKLITNSVETIIRRPPALVSNWPWSELGRNYSSWFMVGVLLLLLSVVACIKLQKTSEQKIVALSFATLGLLLVFLVEPGKGYRFFQLSSVQMILVAACFAELLKGSAKQLGVSVVILYVGFLVPRSLNFRPADNEQQQVVQAIANLTQANGNVHLGYVMPFHEEFLKANVIDSTYKVGANFDYILRHQEGITNLTTSAKGYSSEDEFRVYSTELSSGTMRFDVPMSGWKPAGSFGQYRIYRRSVATSDEN